MEIKKQCHYRIGTFGPPKVGKTAIVNQLIHKKFTKRYIPTTENDIEYITSYGDSTYICLLIDTCGSNDFPAMRRLTIVKCNSFIIVFALDSHDSFLKGSKIIYDIIEQKPGEVFRMVFVGNKKENGKCITWKKSTIFAMKLKAGHKELQCVLLKFHLKTLMMSITCFT